MIAETLRRDGSESGMSTLKLAERLNVNVALMQEHIFLAEEMGFVCRDDSYEGVQWFDNKIMAAF